MALLERLTGLGQRSDKLGEGLQSLIDERLRLLRGLDSIALVIEFLMDDRKITRAYVLKKVELVVGVGDDIVMSRSNFSVLRLQLFETLLHIMELAF